MFLLNRGDVINRADPNFHSLYREVKRRFELSKFPVLNFGRFMKLIQYGSSSLATSENIGVPMIRMNNLQDDELNLTNLKYIELPEKELNLLRLKKGDILFNRTNSKELVGKCAVFREETDYVYASYLIKVRLDETKLLPDFAALFLGSPTGRLQIDCISRQIIGMTNINTEEIKNLKMPVPPIEFQEKAVEQTKKAYDEKKSKEAEAREKLASIDALVLDALGITLPAAEENTLAGRIFFTKSSGIAGGRLDAAIYRRKFSLQSNLFPMAKVKDVYAINPRTSFDRLQPETLLSFVPMEAISDGLGKIVRRYEREVKEAKGYTWFQENDVLWAKITPCMQNGKSAVATNLLNGLGFGSTEYHVFRPSNDKANSFYLHTILRLKSLREAAMDYFGGSAGHQRVDIDFLKNLKIPIPPPEVQAEIAERVEAIYAEAKKLRDEGKDILEKAKSRVEAMILGESSESKL